MMMLRINDENMENGNCKDGGKTYIPMSRVFMNQRSGNTVVWSFYNAACDLKIRQN